MLNGVNDNKINKSLSFYQSKHHFIVKKLVSRLGLIYILSVFTLICQVL